mgnify:CR=1 FL=1
MSTQCNLDQYWSSVQYTCLLIITSKEDIHVLYFVNLEYPFSHARNDVVQHQIPKSPSSVPEPCVSLYYGIGCAWVHMCQVRQQPLEPISASHFMYLIQVTSQSSLNRAWLTEDTISIRMQHRGKGKWSHWFGQRHSATSLLLFNFDGKIEKSLKYVCSKRFSCFK